MKAILNPGCYLTGCGCGCGCAPRHATQAGLGGRRVSSRWRLGLGSKAGTGFFGLCQQPFEHLLDDGRARWPGHA
jgi:hypothetical protein